MLTGDNSLWAVDTSVALAALDESHEAHDSCRSAAVKYKPALAGHAAFETYSVLTRLPGASKVSPGTAMRILKLAFPERCWLNSRQSNKLIEKLSSQAIVGGMVYDVLVGEAAMINNRTLLTRDLRAQRTYNLVGVKFVVVSDEFPEN